LGVSALRLEETVGLTAVGEISLASTAGAEAVGVSFLSSSGLFFLARLARFD